MNKHHPVLGIYHGPTDEEIKAEVCVYSLMRATQDLFELPPDQLESEIDDLELAHARLSQLIQRICNGPHHAM
jgi:hypothetical protein